MNKDFNRSERVAEHIRAFVADFINKESSHKSLITVTKVFVYDSFKKAIIFVTVLPENQEDAVVDFLNRKRGEIQTYLKKHGKLSVIPRFEVKIDKSNEIYDKLKDL